MRRSGRMLWLRSLSESTEKRRFLFSLIFVYVGLELTLMYYIVRFLNERKDAMENIEEHEKKIIQDLTNTEPLDS